MKITNFKVSVLYYPGNHMVLTTLLLGSVYHSDERQVRKWNLIICEVSERSDTEFDQKIQDLWSLPDTFYKTSVF